MAREGGKRRLTNVFWPAIVDEATARGAAKYGAAICGFSAVASLVMAITGFGFVGNEFERYGLIASSIIYAVLGLGILRMWLPAAIMALLLFVGDIITSVIHSGEKPVLDLILLVFFISGVRGTYYYHKNVLPKKKTAMDEPITPS
ncbi:MAG: hypothetical protein WCF31_08000 [Candidatus Deferrimicrobiaceae bacterium]